MRWRFPGHVRRLSSAHYQNFALPQCRVQKRIILDADGVYPQKTGRLMYDEGRIKELAALYKKTARALRESERARFCAFWRKHRRRRGIVCVMGWPHDDFPKLDKHCEPFHSVKWPAGDIFSVFPEDWFCLWEGMFWLDGKGRAPTCAGAAPFPVD